MCEAHLAIRADTQYPHTPKVMSPRALATPWPKFAVIFMRNRDLMMGTLRLTRSRTGKEIELSVEFFRGYGLDPRINAARKKRGVMSLTAMTVRLSRWMDG